jgi:uncharacterized protein (DUF488 family)
MVHSAGQPVSRLELVKWAFLLRRESGLGDSEPFYDFLPYRYGPFSFTLQHEVTALVRDGFLAEPDDKHWAATPSTSGAMKNLSTEHAAKVHSTLASVAGKSVDEVIEHVYDKYPWYAVNSKRQRRPHVERPVAEAKIYTTGYEGLSVDAFFDRLLRRGARRLVDVRKNPVARRYGFHKSTLQRICDNVGLSYEHLPSMGIPSEWRRNLDSGDDYERLFSRYESEVLPREADAVNALSEEVSRESSVLVCMESDPALCHRTRLARALSGRNRLEIVNW